MEVHTVSATGFSAGLSRKGVGSLDRSLPGLAVLGVASGTVIGTVLIHTVYRCFGDKGDVEDITEG